MRECLTVVPFERSNGSCVVGLHSKGRGVTKSRNGRTTAFVGGVKRCFGSKFTTASCTATRSVFLSKGSTVCCVNS